MTENSSGTRQIAGMPAQSTPSTATSAQDSSAGNTSTQKGTTPAHSQSELAQSMHAPKPAKIPTSTHPPTTHAPDLWMWNPSTPPPAQPAHQLPFVLPDPISFARMLPLEDTQIGNPHLQESKRHLSPRVKGRVKEPLTRGTFPRVFIPFLNLQDPNQDL